MSTRRVTPEEPFFLLADAMAMGPSGAIEASEARGQRAAVTSDQIPADLRGGTDDDLIALGFTLGPKQTGALFRDATLPPGWTKRGSEHPLWSEILDEQGRVRASIFYKAAFYDRCAFMTLVKEVVS